MVSAGRGTHMTVETVKECVRKTADVLPLVVCLFDSIIGVNFYDGKVRIHGYAPKDREHLLKYATKMHLTDTDFDEYDVDFDGVLVCWLEYRGNTNNETV